MKTPTRIMKYESQVIKSNPVNTLKISYLEVNTGHGRLLCYQYG